jgi:hypothetical protein
MKEPAGRVSRQKKRHPVFKKKTGTPANASAVKGEEEMAQQHPPDSDRRHDIPSRFCPIVLYDSILRRGLSNDILRFYDEITHFLWIAQTAPIHSPQIAHHAEPGGGTVQKRCRQTMIGHAAADI